MKTDKLIAMLAGGGAATVPHAVARRYAAAMGVGACATLLLMALWLGVRRDIGAASLLPMFWVKLAFAGGLCAAAVLAAQRLSRPGARAGRALGWIALPVLAMWLLAAVVLLGAQTGARAHLIFGVSWLVCPAYIAALSLPAFVAVFWAMRGLAPTLALPAGAAGGLAAGALGALAYSLYCREMAAPFVGLWYLLGMLIPAAAGALLGPRLLRW